MVKVYVVYTKLDTEKEPRLHVTHRKRFANEHYQMYEELRKSRPGRKIINRMRTINF